MAGRIRVGVGGWVFEPWRGSFYPDGLAQKRELDFMSRHLTSIEINGTYYGSQKPESFRRWHAETPDDFVFSVKGPRFATNRKVLAEGRDSVNRFLDSGVLELGSKLGAINWQFMATKKFEPEDFAAFLDLLPAEVGSQPLRHAVEVRHASFRDPLLTTMARQRSVAVIVAGDSDYPQIADPTAPFVYARIMGTSGDKAAGYDAAALATWSVRAQRWAEGGVPEGLEYVDPSGVAAQERDVYLYVISGAKERNPAAAMALIERLTSQARS